MSNRLHKNNKLTYFVAQIQFKIYANLKTNQMKRSETKQIPDLENSIFKRVLRLVCLVAVCTFLLSSYSYAQEIKTVQGIISTEDGKPLPRVNVVVKGTTAGTATNFSGEYIIEVNANDILVFSFLGFKSQEVKVSDKTIINIILEEDIRGLEEVVVTALGIKREKKALGYSVTEVKADDISKNGEMNAIASLAGKVAGVDITQTTAGPSGSKRVVIRGISELDGNNQPLYVIDGVPVENSTLGQASEFGGFDLGDGTADLNPEDIESISVLKGASASALYGSRAMNGVILITTKSGATGEGLGIDFNSSSTFDAVSTKLDEYQTTYGQGSNGILPREGQPANNITSAWGPKLDPSITILQRDGIEHPYRLVKDNIQDFFRVGRTLSNSIALSSGNETGSVRFSYSNVNNKDIIPESGLERNSFNLRGKTKLGKLIDLDAKASYMTEEVDNRPAMTDDVTNIGNGLVGIVPNFDQTWLKTYKDADGRYIDYTGNIYRANPYWTINETFNKSEKNRFVGFVSFNINLHQNLKLRLKSGIDRYDFKFTNFYNNNTPTKQGGLYYENNSIVQEVNHEALLSFNKAIHEDWNISASIGGNIMESSNSINEITGSEIDEPGIASIINFKNIEVSPALYQKEIQSVYGFGQVGYKNVVFIDVTARNDWSSTLPSNNNSYFYPSVSGSFIFTEAADLDLPWLTYGKLRASWAQVGSDTDPYRLNLTYRLTGKSFKGISMGEIFESVIPNSGLLPQTTTSYEFGTDLRFFNNAIGLDATYYKQTTDDQILSVEVPEVSGYTHAILNSGALENKGLELQLTARPFDRNFKWDITFNYTKVWNKVVSLHEDVDAYTIANARWSGVSVVAFEDMEFGQITGRGYKRDPQGNIVHDAESGLPLSTDTPITLGSILPDWTGGVINTFTYKNFTLKTSLDIRMGGDIYSITNRGMVIGGTHASTLGGREGFNDWAARNEKDRQDWIDGGGAPEDHVPLPIDGGYIGEGVKLVSVDENGNETYETNDIITNPQQYWNQAATDIPETNVYDASYIKIRDISLGYTFPKSVLGNTPIQSLTLSVLGRNLFTLYKNVPNIDPESTYNNGNGQGLEYGSLPTRRHYGINLNIKF